MLINVDMYVKSISHERSLLAQVVLVAINDACTKPSEETRRANHKYLMTSNRRMHRDTFTAMRFLFDKSKSGLNEYAIWLDFDADQFRAKLLKLMADSSNNVISSYTPMDRRYFRINYKLFQLLSESDKNVLDIDSEIDDDASYDDVIND
jgi:hypothetical protein